VPGRCTVACDFFFLLTSVGRFANCRYGKFAYRGSRTAEEILIGYFVECQAIKKVVGRRSVEELYQALFFVSPFRLNVSPSKTKIEPNRRLRLLSYFHAHLNKERPCYSHVQFIFCSF